MDDLTDKQQAFVQHYLDCLNGAEAARRAGYGAAGARVEAHRLLTKPNIRAAIDAELRARALSKDEVLARLAEHATASMDDFLTVNGRGVTLDLKKAALADRLHLIKKYTKTKQGVSIELYDAQAALVKLGEHYRLFVQRQEITGKDGGPIDVSDARQQLAAALAGLTAPGDASAASGGDHDPAAGDRSGPGA